MQRKRRAYCPPSWIVPLYWVIRRAIRLNELPVQNKKTTHANHTAIADSPEAKALRDG